MGLVVQCLKALPYELREAPALEMAESRPQLHPVVAGVAGGQVSLMELKSTIKCSLVGLLQALLEPGLAPESPVPRLVFGQLDPRALLDELAAIRAQSPVLELGLLAPRPWPQPPFGLTQHLEQGQPSAAAHESLEKLTELAFGIFLVLRSFCGPEARAPIGGVGLSLAQLIPEGHSAACQACTPEARRECRCMEHVVAPLRAATSSVELLRQGRLVKHCFRVPQAALSLRGDEAFAARARHV